MPHCADFMQAGVCVTKGPLCGVSYSSFPSLSRAVSDQVPCYNKISCALLPSASTTAVTMHLCALLGSYKVLDVGTALPFGPCAN